MRRPRCWRRRRASSICRSARCCGRAARCFSALLLGGPVLLAAAIRIVTATTPFWRFPINGAEVGGPALFGMMIWLLYIRFIVPVLGVFYGTSLIADEVDDKTITYLFIPC